MTTDELLEKATERPWWVAKADLRGVLAGGGAEVGHFVASQEVIPTDPEEGEANAALTVRAVNSFEALRKCVEQTCLDCGLAEETGGKCGGCMFGKALKLADGEK